MIAVATAPLTERWLSKTIPSPSCLPRQQPQDHFNKLPQRAKGNLLRLQEPSTRLRNGIILWLDARLSSRLAKEAKDIMTDPPGGIRFGRFSAYLTCSAAPVNDNIMSWQAKIIGPEGSPYCRIKHNRWYQGMKAASFLSILSFPTRIPSVRPKSVSKLRFSIATSTAAATSVSIPSKMPGSPLSCRVWSRSPALTIGKVLLSVSLPFFNLYCRFWRYYVIQIQMILWFQISPETTRPIARNTTRLQKNGQREYVLPTPFDNSMRVGRCYFGWCFGNMHSSFCFMVLINRSLGAQWTRILNSNSNSASIPSNISQSLTIHATSQKEPRNQKVSGLTGLDVGAGGGVGPNGVNGISLETNPATKHKSSSAS